EFPLSTIRIAGLNIPIAGGGYFRIFPYFLTRWGMRRLNRRERQPALFYLHPWEVDPQQPRIAASVLSKFRHYRNLEKTESRLVRLMKDFEFGPIRDVLKQQNFFPVSNSVERSGGQMRRGA
ncbi:MAG: DUF3473 domain-containing protein, partial [Terriglobia bacterium]